MKWIKNNWNLHSFLLLAIVIVTTSCMDTGGDSRKGRVPLKSNVIVATATPTPTATPETPKRPGEPGTSTAVFIQRNFCSCLAGKADILNDCAAFCSGKNDASPTLYLYTKLGADIELNDKLKNLRGWCTNQISDSTTTTGGGAPQCNLMYDDGFGAKKIPLPAEAISASNSIKLDIKDLKINQTYVVYIQELTSGAKSDAIHIRRINPPSAEVPNLGPLKITPISQFVCMYRGITPQTPPLYDQAFKHHFYYVDQNLPPSLPAGNPYVFCHDQIQYGEIDQPIFPRLELQPNFFKMWNETDSRFIDLMSYDATGKVVSTPNQQPDINDEIKEKLRQAGISSGANYFVYFEWLAYPGISNPPRLGYLMTPFIDPITYHATCPTQADYNSNSTLMRILKDTVGVDTEGIYIAQKEAECYTTRAGELKPALDDYMLIREGLLKKIWWYIKNGVRTEPTESVFNSNTSISFYWPPDESSPYVQKSTQKLYTIRYTDELGTPNTICGSPAPANAPNSTPPTPRTTLRASDKRIGCIPAILD